MKSSKLYLILLFIALACLPFSAIQAQTQENVSELTELTQTLDTDQQSSDSDSQDSKDGKEKKKDKKKNADSDKSLKITESFYINFLIDILTIIIIVVFIYYRNYRNKEVFFTYFLFNIAIFLLTFLLNQVKISMGAAFGLFAVFSMLRYRTEGISVKDMTYLFIVIAIGLLSAVMHEYYELLIINGILVLSTFILDGNILFKHETHRQIQYEKIELIKAQNYDKLIVDLRERTGLNIHRVSINKMDFLKDTASINVYYYADKKTSSLTETDM